MATLIRLNDGEGPLVEVDLPVTEAQLASSGTVIKVVGKGFEELLSTLSSIIVPFKHVWQELSKDAVISETTVSVSLGVTAEGNFFLAKGDAKANLEVTMKLTPKPAPALPPKP